MEATKAIASMPPGLCLGAPEYAPVEVYNFRIGCPPWLPHPSHECLIMTNAGIKMK